jgi:hypothetical protein
VRPFTPLATPPHVLHTRPVAHLLLCPPLGGPSRRRLLPQSPDAMRIRPGARAQSHDTTPHPCTHMHCQLASLQAPPKRVATAKPANPNRRHRTWRDIIVPERHLCARRPQLSPVVRHSDGRDAYAYDETCGATRVVPTTKRPARALFSPFVSPFESQTNPFVSRTNPARSSLRAQRTARNGTHSRRATHWLRARVRLERTGLHPCRRLPRRRSRQRTSCRPTAGSISVLQRGFAWAVPTGPQQSRNAMVSPLRRAPHPFCHVPSHHQERPSNIRVSAR